MSDTKTVDQEILEARKKMAEEFGNMQLGGKGTQKRKSVSFSYTLHGSVYIYFQQVGQTCFL